MKLIMLYMLGMLTCHKHTQKSKNGCTMNQMESDQGLTGGPLSPISRSAEGFWLMNSVRTELSKHTRGPTSVHTPHLSTRICLLSIIYNFMVMLYSMPYRHKGPLYWKLLCYWIGMIGIWSIGRIPGDHCTDMIGLAWDWLWWLYYWPVSVQAGQPLTY